MNRGLLLLPFLATCVSPSAGVGASDQEVIDLTPALREQIVEAITEHLRFKYGKDALVHVLRSVPGEETRRGWYKDRPVERLAGFIRREIPDCPQAEIDYFFEEFPPPPVGKLTWSGLPYPDEPGIPDPPYPEWNGEPSPWRISIFLPGSHSINSGKIVFVKIDEKDPKSGYGSINEALVRVDFQSGGPWVEVNTMMWLSWTDVLWILPANAEQEGTSGS